MHTTITTTITTRIDIDTFEPDHEVLIDAEDSILPRDAIMAAVSGGLKSALAAMGQP